MILYGSEQVCGPRPREASDAVTHKSSSLWMAEIHKMLGNRISNWTSYYLCRNGSVGAVRAI